MTVGVYSASFDELHGGRAQRTGRFNRNHGHGHGQHLLSADHGKRGYASSDTPVPLPACRVAAPSCEYLGYAALDGA